VATANAGSPAGNLNRWAPVVVDAPKDWASTRKQSLSPSPSLSKIRFDPSNVCSVRIFHLKLERLKRRSWTGSRNNRTFTIVLLLNVKYFSVTERSSFFERRKIERRIRRLEKMQRTSSGQSQEAEIAEQLSKLKEDLEYVRFFPKTEKYVALFIGGDETDVVDRRNRLRKQIKANIIAAAASGKDLEETGSEDDGLLDLSEDDFFLAGSSSDEAEADDEWTDRSAREQASSASGKAASGMSSDERNQRQISARALMPPPRPSTKSFSNSDRGKSRFGGSSSKKQPSWRAEMSTSGNTSNSTSESSFRNRGSSDSRTGHSSNLSSNSDAHKPRRKRRPKKKRQQA